MAWSGAAAACWSGARQASRPDSAASCSIVAVRWPAVLLIHAQVAQLSARLAAEYQYARRRSAALSLLSLTNLSLNFTDALVSAF